MLTYDPVVLSGRYRCNVIDWPAPPSWWPIAKTWSAIDVAEAKWKHARWIERTHGVTLPPSRISIEIVRMTVRVSDIAR